jgi:hypothetical protein
LTIKNCREDALPKLKKTLAEPANLFRVNKRQVRATMIAKKPFHH